LFLYTYVDNIENYGRKDKVNRGMPEKNRNTETE